MINFGKNDIKIFLASFAMLFLEIALIRWISTEIRIFAYLNNLVILACFLGIGLGCYLSNKKCDLSITVLMLSMLIIFVNLPFVFDIKGYKAHFFRDIPMLLSTFTDSVIWSGSILGPSLLNFLLGVSATMLIFFVVLFTFIPLGQVLGAAFNEHKSAIRAYSINIIASVLGVWFFSFLSFLYLKPWMWFAIFSVIIFIMILLYEKHETNKVLTIFLFILLIVSTMFMQSSLKGGTYTIWSPYQKLEIGNLKDKVSNINRGYYIGVNNTDFMFLLDLSDSFVKGHPEYFNPNDRKFSQYDIPYLFKKDAKDVLIVGAGAGNDAAGALRNGVNHVDAAEIDPAIYLLGSTFHPEKPYKDPRVKMAIDDARSFFKKTDKRYDLISFGLLDAHTLSSNYNNMRIDHYVYTKESFEEAKRLLKKDGVLTVIFMAHKSWIAKRIFNLLRESFNADPIAFAFGSGPYGYGGSMFVIGNTMANITNTINNNPNLKRFISKNAPNLLDKQSMAVKVTTDDWPYLYLEKPAIPKMHLSVIFVLLVIFLLSRKYILPRKERINPHFFFLGAAFLLLEFQNISKTTLFFGSTWFVNTLTITAILVLSLCANLFVYFYKIKDPKIIYTMLIASLFVLFFMPMGIFNSLPHLYKFILVSVVLNLPVFFSGIIFINSFRSAAHKDFAFGSNIIGAAAGGLLESASFIVGIKALILAVIVFYLLSFVFIKERA